MVNPGKFFKYSVLSRLIQAYLNKRLASHYNPLSSRTIFLRVHLSLNSHILLSYSLPI